MCPVHPRGHEGLEALAQREAPFDPLAYLPISGQLTVTISSGRLAAGMGGKVAGKWNPYVCCVLAWPGPAPCGGAAHGVR
jgi:hypothetical protein